MVLETTCGTSALARTYVGTGVAYRCGSNCPLVYLHVRTKVLPYYHHLSANLLCSHWPENLNFLSTLGSVLYLMSAADLASVLSEGVIWRGVGVPVNVIGSKFNDRSRSTSDSTRLTISEYVFEFILHHPV